MNMWKDNNMLLKESYDFRNDDIKNAVNTLIKYFKDPSPIENNYKCITSEKLKSLDKYKNGLSEEDFNEACDTSDAFYEDCRKISDTYKVYLENKNYLIKAVSELIKCEQELKELTNKAYKDREDLTVILQNVEE